MNKQKKLKRPSPGLTFKVRINNHAIFLRTGEYEDGTLGEIFIDMYKEGAGYKAILANFSITVSWLLQYGVPLERLVDKFQYTRFEPAGIVTGDDEIKMCTSILDYVFRRLGITYLDMNELGNVKKDEISIEVETPVEFHAGIQRYNLASGSIGIRPIGYKSKEFLEYCRKNKNHKTIIYGEFQLGFNDDSIVIFDAPSNKERDLDAIKRMWFAFYGKPLTPGDV